MAKPGFFLYTGDWIKDTRVLSAEAKGCWIDSLCFLHDHGGIVTWPITAFANFWSVSTEIATKILEELGSSRVADVEWQNDRKTIAKLRNRRMVRELDYRKQISLFRSEAGKKGNAKRWQKSHSSESSSSSQNLLKIKNQESDPAAPEPSADLFGQKPRSLDPRIKRAADPIYNSDPKKFDRLIVWIGEAQKNHFSTESIVRALEQFQPYTRSVVQWYPYLDKLILKASQDLSRDYHEQKHQEYNEDERAAAKLFSMQGKKNA